MKLSHTIETYHMSFGWDHSKLTVVMILDIFENAWIKHVFILHSFQKKCVKKEGKFYYSILWNSTKHKQSLITQISYFFFYI